MAVTCRLAIALMLWMWSMPASAEDPETSLDSDAVADEGREDETSPESSIEGALERTEGPEEKPRVAIIQPFPLESILGPLEEDRLFREAEVAVQVVNVDTGDEVYAWESDLALVPASVMKLLTTAVALRTLGPAWQYETRVHRIGEILPDGVLDGDLVVVGAGDPTLVVEDLWSLMRQVKLAGNQHVSGDVIFDASYFDNEYLVRGWRKQVDLATGPAYFAPIGSLSVNHNTVTLVVQPGLEAGGPARVELETAAPAIQVENQVVTARDGARRWIKIEREMDEVTGLVSFIVEGQVPGDDHLRRYYRSVGDPTPHFMSVFEQLLADEDIEVEGAIRQGRLTDKEAEVVALHESRALAEVVNHTNKFSSNLMAEHLLRTIGAETTEQPGSVDAGLEVIASYLVSLGAERDEFRLVNGSGLSRDIQLRASHITAVLMDMHHDRLYAPEYLSSLSIGGVDGTLRQRFDGVDEAGRVRGKTGSLNGVYCIAGYVEAGDGVTYAFAFLVNGFRRARSVRVLHDRFGEAMLGMDAIPGGALPNEEP